MGSRSACALIPALLVAALAGCGTADDRHRARAVAEGLYADVQAGQGRAACARMSADARKELESQESKPCAEAILGLDLEGSRAGSVEVYVGEAIVRLAGGDTVFLDDTAEGWRVSALGCHAEDTEQPAECEVQA